MTRRPGGDCLRETRWVLLVGACVSAAVFVSCGSGDASSPSASPEVATSSRSVERPRDAESSTRPRIVALGDSLTAGLGLPADLAYPSQLQSMLEDEGFELEVVNAGVSGDTSAGGLRRLTWALEGDVRVLILALGANDGLRGVSVAEMKRNLGAIISRAKARRIDVLLAGMEAPPNFGQTYTVEFREAFRELADEHDVVFVPFLLDGVAGFAELNQADGMHPNATGARMVADLVWPALRPMLDTSPAP